MSTWKKITLIIGGTTLVAGAVTVATGTWDDIANTALCKIQTKMGSKRHFHIRSFGPADWFVCPYSKE